MLSVLKFALVTAMRLLYNNAVTNKTKATAKCSRSLNCDRQNGKLKCNTTAIS